MRSLISRTSDIIIYDIDGNCIITAKANVARRSRYNGSRKTTHRRYARHQVHSPLTAKDVIRERRHSIVNEDQRLNILKCIGNHLNE